MSGIASAQCVLDPITVPAVEGYLVFGFQGKNRIVEKAEVLILDQHNPQKVLATTAVNENGYFILRGIKPGKYILSGRSEKLTPAFVDISVIKAKHHAKTPENETLVLIMLGADTTKECAGASITVMPKSNVEKLIQSANRK